MKDKRGLEKPANISNYLFTGCNLFPSVLDYLDFNQFLRCGTYATAFHNARHLAIVICSASSGEAPEARC